MMMCIMARARARSVPTFGATHSSAIEADSLLTGSTTTTFPPPALIMGIVLEKFGVRRVPRVAVRLRHVGAPEDRKLRPDVIRLAISPMTEVTPSCLGREQRCPTLVFRWDPKAPRS